MNKILDKVLIESGNLEITVSMIITIAIALGITFLLTFLIRKIFLRKYGPKQDESSRKYSIFSLIKYTLWLLVIIFCFNVAGVRITYLLAGSAALLVGLGIGLQQTFNDIVSGIIILFEGTIKVNDVVEVQGVVGRVVKISLRTSKIFTRDAIYIIVPNHKFINENVINWSHDSKMTRFKINVGVAYGSDVEKVREVLYQCAYEHPKVIRNDDDRVITVRLMDFGNSSLDFELLFWSPDIFRIEFIKSEIRYKIVEEFRKNGITIPFPQRDVHLKDQ